ncbi:MAG: PD-(D/E)XK nuclease family protein [Planctomycetota bacterium]|nr:PD-(D/E)XK nuclease family protein [Planctomycetota bacterium]
MNAEEALNELLASPDFAELERVLAKQGLFQILGIETKETAHTRLLAWLLHPANGPHGAGALRSFLSFVWRQKGGQNAARLSPIQLERLDLTTAEAFPEYVVDARSGFRGSGRIDVLVQARVGQKSLPLVVIEYKVDAVEGEGQTHDYAAWVDEQWREVSGLAPTLVFISPNDIAKCDRFTSIGFDKFYEWLGDLSFLPDATTTYMHAVEELKRAVGLRARFQPDIVHQIENLHADAIGVLRSARRGDGGSGEAVENALVRHRAALRVLGIGLFGRRSPGDSAWVTEVDRHLREEAAIAVERWYPTAGAGQLLYWDKMVSDVRRQVFQDTAALWAGLWMTRPADGRSMIEYSMGTDLGEWKKDLRVQKLADGLRKLLREEYLPPDQLGKDGSLVVARLPIALSSPEDTAQVAEESWRVNSAGILHFVGKIEAGVEQWLKSANVEQELQRWRGSDQNQ